MGFIQAALDAAGGVLNDQWKEYFYCDSLSSDILVAKGHKRNKRGNNSGDDNIITQGSLVAVNNGQCMMVVENGKVVDFIAEPGEYKYDRSTEPSLFSGGNLAVNIQEIFYQIGHRFTYGGETGKDQRVYYFNTKEITGNKYGTPTAIPFRVVDNNIGLDIDISIKCFGSYSYKIVNPILFYTNVCGNITDTYNREEIDRQLKSELMTALQPAFARISEMGIRYSALPAHTNEIADALNQVLSKKWGELRGLQIVSFGVSNVSISEQDEAMLKEIQQRQLSATLRNPSMAAAHMANAQAAAMQAAASNSAGAAVGFMGMNMAQNSGGINANNLFTLAQQQQMQQQQMQQQLPPQPPQETGWKCEECGQTGNKGKFCANCGKPQHKPQNFGWKCESCGHEGNTGKFCAECGKPKPSVADEWTCHKCGTVNKGKFCADCGAPKPSANTASNEWTCSACGTVNKGRRFCAECGKPRG